jgi:hypothetical protein
VFLAHYMLGTGVLIFPPVHEEGMTKCLRTAFVIVQDEWRCSYTNNQVSHMSIELVTVHAHHLLHSAVTHSPIASTRVMKP